MTERTRQTSTARRSRRAAAAAAFAALCLLVLTVATPASAHTGNQTYLYLDISESQVGGRIEAPLRDLNEALGVDAHGSDDDVLATLLADQDRIASYFDEHLEIGAGGESWPVTFEPAELFYSDLPEGDDNYIVYWFTADVAGATVPRTLDVTFDPFFDDIDGRDALVLIANDWAGGVMENGAEVYSAFDARSRTQSIDLGDTGWYKTLTASAKLGVNHIRTGPDHILFVLVLLLPSVLVFSLGWHPTASFGAALWRVLKIVTMFTVAHSITFSLAGLDILPLPPSKLVEAIIAISIAAAALHNLRPIAPNKEWLIAFAFGLFHGMGFASLVEGLDVSRSTQLLSLLGRNIGIEIGQAAVVLLLFPGLFLLRRTRYFQGFFIGVSLLLTVVSLGWMVERIAEVELGVSAWVDPVVKFPQALIIVAVFTAIAAAVHRVEHLNDRLVPAGGSAGPAVTPESNEPVGSAV